jgi:hypothetical protein
MAAHLMLLYCLVVSLFLKMQLVRVAEMSLVFHHLLPSHDQTLFQEEGSVRFVLMQFPSPQDQVVQQNVPGCGNRTAVTEPQPDKKNIVLKCGRSCLAVL